jgi:hypothetical protein
MGMSKRRLRLRNSGSGEKRGENRREPAVLVRERDEEVVPPAGPEGPRRRIGERESKRSCGEKGCAGLGIRVAEIAEKMLGMNGIRG